MARLFVGRLTAVVPPPVVAPPPVWTPDVAAPLAAFGLSPADEALVELLAVAEGVEVEDVDDVVDVGMLTSC